MELRPTATAHYATANLDKRAIIKQAAKRISIDHCSTVVFDK